MAFKNDRSVISLQDKQVPIPWARISPPSGSSREEIMAKAYWVVCYRSISDPAARDAYTKLAVPAVLASGGRFLARGLPAKTYEGGIDQRTVLVEFDSLAQAIAAHESSGYQAALAVLGSAAERDLRIVEGIDG
jgi:uncharacterized protein (DUF1330 family)